MYSHLNFPLTETLRKYPVLSQLMRVASSNYETGVPGYMIEKDTMVLIPIEAYQNDQNIFPEPEKFQPERFEVDEVQKRHATSWMPFGEGPRNCIGMRFGVMQTRIGLISLWVIRSCHSL